MDKRRPLAFPVPAVLFVAILACVSFGCGNDDSKIPSQPKVIRGFSFFDLGADSRYSKMVRRTLGKKLGSDAVSHRNVLDLTIYSDAFFKKYFPQLWRLNLQLNWPEGQRIEHNTTELMYRYARLKETPFTKVTLFFSDDTGKPLFFRISAGPDADAVVETIKKKYGSPEQFEWQNKDGRTFFWKDGKDFFIVSSTKDRQGNPEYLFCIYYVNNLEEMLAAERARQRSEKEKIREAGESAF